MSDTQKIRQLCATVEKGDVVAAEQQAREVASFIMKIDEDPKLSFVTHEGFRLCYAHLQLLSSSATNTDENQVKLQNLLASLMPAGRCGILNRETPAALAEKQQSSKLTDEAHRELKEKLVSAFPTSSSAPSSPKLNTTTFSSAATLQQSFTPLQLSNLSTTASKVTKWNSENYTLTTTNSEMMVQSVIDCCNNLAEAFYFPSPPQQSSQPSLPPSETCEPLQLLCFLVAARAESFSYQKIQGTPIIARKLQTDLLMAKKRFVQSCYSFESQRGLFGVVVPYVRFAALWFAPPSEPKQFAKECLRIFMSSASNNNDNEEEESSPVTRRRQRRESQLEKEERQLIQQQNEENENSEKEMTFDEKMKDRIENLPSLLENAKDDAEAGFSSIAQEIEFNDGAAPSNTGRDVDRLIPFLRNVLFSASPFSAKDKKENNNLAFRRATAVAFDRVRDGSKYSEPRSVVPHNSANSSSSSMLGEDSTSNTSTTKTALERIATVLTE